MVYCATVPNGLLIVRRNGKVVVSGNSPGEPGAVPYRDWRPGPDGQQQFYDAAQRSFATPLDGFRGFAQFLTQNQRYAPALERYQQTGDVNQLAADIHAAGYAEDPAYTSKIQSIIKGIPTPTGVGEVVDQRGKPLATRPAASPVQGLAPDVPGDWRQAWGDNLTPHQINETLALGMDWDSAIATCGVAAAVAFARANGGQPPTFGQALRLAQDSGEWNADVGMTGGSAGEIRLLKKLGVDAHALPVNEQQIAKTVMAGKPVQINAHGNGGHFYVAQDYDPETGQFDFGNSAAILKRAEGRRWFRLNDLAGLGVGTPSEAIYLGGR